MERSTPDIRRKNKNRYTEIDINIGKSTMGPVQTKIQNELDKMEWAFGHDEIIKKLIKELGLD